MTASSVKTFILKLGFVALIGWLLFVWAPMVRRDNAVNVDKVLEESRATVGRVESELKRIGTENKRVGSELQKSFLEESQSH